MARIDITAGRQAFAGSFTDVYGYSGVENLYVIPGSSAITFDQNVERVIFVGAISLYSFKQMGNILRVYKDNTTIATGSIQGDADGTKLTFTDGTVEAKLISGVMTVGGVTVPATIVSVVPTTIVTSDVTANYANRTSSGASLYLAVGEHSYASSNTAVYGNTGLESIQVISGATNIYFDQNLDKLIFSGNISEYSFGQSGNQIHIFKGGSLIAYGEVQGDADGTQLTFSDGTVNTTLVSGTMKVGGTTVTGTTTTPTTIVPTTINTGTTTGTPVDISTDPSSVPTGPSLYLAVNEQVLVNSNTRVFGNTGIESIIVTTGSTNITFDQNLERVILNGNIGDYTFGQSGGEIYVYKGGVLVVRGVIQTDADGTQLTFNGGTVNVVTSGGTVTVGGTTLTGTPTTPTPVVPTTTNTSVTTGTTGTTTGTTKYLAVNEQASVGSNVSVFGNSGSESIVVIPGSSNITFNQSVEKIILTGNISEYTFGQSGGEVFIFKNGTLVIKGVVQTDTDGTQLTFDNGTVNVTVVGGVVTVGGTTVTGTPTTPTTVVPTVINTGTTTGTSTPTVIRTTLNLAVNEYVHVGSTTDVHGNTGTEGISVIPGSTDITFDQAVEQILLTGNMNEYTFGKNGNELYVFKNGSIIVHGLVQTDVNGTKLTFDNGTVNVTLSGGSMFIGGTVVTGTSTSPTAVVPTTIDPDVTTSTGTAGVSTATLTAYVKSYGGNVLAFDDDFGAKYPNMRITAVWGIH